jgi:long-chain acyl-CoA synthetase
MKRRKSTLLQYGCPDPVECGTRPFGVDGRLHALTKVRMALSAARPHAPPAHVPQAREPATTFGRSNPPAASAEASRAGSESVPGTLLDFFDRAITSPAEFFVYDTGYRSWSYTYDQVRGASLQFAARLAATGIRKGEKVIVWGENRAEWVVAFWGCVLQGVIVVPIDYRASIDLVRRIRDIVRPRAVLVGDEVHADGEIGIPVWRLAEIDWSERPSNYERPAIGAGDIAEIMFTSGATAEPKGVVITHQNILANIAPVEREVAKYRPYARPLFPIRFLNLLPLSHMFGQAMAAFIPPMLHGVVVFMRGYNPNEIARQIKSRRITILVGVPKMLELLRAHVLQHVSEAKEATDPAATQRWVLSRIWRYRRAHRLLGWKFWAFVVGAAPLERDLEDFWTRLGFAVVQGYGLTETAPIVTLVHPFKPAPGTVGEPIPGVDVKIADDGEILVRGPNVTPGYFGADAETRQAFEGGWFHTGDIGEMDASGRLVVRGRKKEMIATPEGMKVFPDDVERVLHEIPGVRESAVVGIAHDGQERVHAILSLEPGKSQDEVVRAANTRLEEHQRIRSASVWPGDALPRTEGTKKLKRRELKRWAESGSGGAPRTEPAAEESVAGVVGRLARRDVRSETTLDELGFSSLERIELMTELEDQFDVTVDESAFSNVQTVADLDALVQRAAAVPTPGGTSAERLREGAREPIAFPAWNRRVTARTVRRAGLSSLILPLTRAFAWIDVKGLEHLDALRGPVIFAANHQSHMDTPVILAALPRPWRYRVAPAMAKEFFDAHYHPDRHPMRQVWPNRLAYYLATLFFNAFPLPQREAGAREALRYIGDLVSDGLSILIFPEGERTETGEIGRFRPGVGMMAARLEVPVMPVRLEGLDRVLHREWHMARPGRVAVTFGAPMTLKGQDYVALAQQVEDAVKHL